MEGISFGRKDARSQLTAGASEGGPGPADYYDTEDAGREAWGNSQGPSIGLPFRSPRQVRERQRLERKQREKVRRAVESAAERNELLNEGGHAEDASTRSEGRQVPDDVDGGSSNSPDDDLTSRWGGGWADADEKNALPGKTATAKAPLDTDE